MVIFSFLYTDLYENKTCLIIVNAYIISHWNPYVTRENKKQNELKSECCDHNKQSKNILKVKFTIKLF